MLYASARQYRVHHGTVPRAQAGRLPSSSTTLTPNLIPENIFIIIFYSRKPATSWIGHWSSHQPVLDLNPHSASATRWHLKLTVLVATLASNRYFCLLFEYFIKSAGLCYYWFISTICSSECVQYSFAHAHTLAGPQNRRWLHEERSSHLPYQDNDDQAGAGQGLSLPCTEPSGWLCLQCAPHYSTLTQLLIPRTLCYATRIGIGFCPNSKPPMSRARSPRSECRHINKVGRGVGMVSIPLNFKANPTLHLIHHFVVEAEEEGIQSFSSREPPNAVQGNRTQAQPTEFARKHTQHCSTMNGTKSTDACLFDRLT